MWPFYHRFQEDKMEDNRYSRQQLVPGFGPEAQKKLSQSRVLVVGAGGLGLPVLLALAGAGVGTLGVCDFDTVSLSNLHRQTVFKTAEVGQPKAELAAAYLRALNPEVRIQVHASGLKPDEHLRDLLTDYELIVDGSDNFETRYLVNDSCALLGLPLVFGAIFRDSGHAVLLHHPDAQGYAANYRDLFPNLPAPGEVPNCAEAGVLGVLPGIIGNMMAAEASRSLWEGHCIYTIRFVCFR
ncbi:UBA/THIF-type NAD/FAD binding protein [Nitritalea halalkaliphila LW7]|uniref:UBA/THIF-type NAD/FAD binding protein n=1 Tax=Nitritalea halalkaliphila LW7 TaxID=1189621 RepID=I5C7M6_9BACT|nr:HesA/MoeB/ThiF family protein [Nitritalea halalkaliphila]EIM77828.1 UBA/THIF-type NAD/FAD binding protein [Nitritalea halalkaliphila LW7]